MYDSTLRQIKFLTDLLLDKSWWRHSISWCSIQHNQIHTILGNNTQKIKISFALIKSPTSPLGRKDSKRICRLQWKIASISLLKAMNQVCLWFGFTNIYRHGKDAGFISKSRTFSYHTTDLLLTIQL